MFRKKNGFYYTETDDQFNPLTHGCHEKLNTNPNNAGCFQGKLSKKMMDLPSSLIPKTNMDPLRLKLGITPQREKKTSTFFPCTSISPDPCSFKAWQLEGKCCTGWWLSISSEKYESKWGEKIYI